MIMTMMMMTMRTSTGDDTTADGDDDDVHSEHTNDAELKMGRGGW